jgi:hypothetical protein
VSGKQVFSGRAHTMNWVCSSESARAATAEAEVARLQRMVSAFRDQSVQLQTKVAKLEAERDGAVLEKTR